MPGYKGRQRKPSRAEGRLILPHLIIPVFRSSNIPIFLNCKWHPFHIWLEMDWGKGIEKEENFLVKFSSVSKTCQVTLPRFLMRTIDLGPGLPAPGGLPLLLSDPGFQHLMAAQCHGTAGGERPGWVHELRGEKTTREKEKKRFLCEADTHLGSARARRVMAWGALHQNEQILLPTGPPHSQRRAREKVHHMQCNPRWRSSKSSILVGLSNGFATSCSSQRHFSIGKQPPRAPPGTAAPTAWKSVGRRHR